MFIMHDYHIIKSFPIRSSNHLAGSHIIHHSISCSPQFERRWLAERIIEIASAIHHRWFAHDPLEDSYYCFTEIQRVVHGYLSTMHIFDKKELAEAAWRCRRRLVLAVFGGGRFSAGGDSFMGRWMCRWWKRLFSREADPAEAAWRCQWRLVAFGVAWIGRHLFVHLVVGRLRREDLRKCSIGSLILK